MGISIVKKMAAYQALFPFNKTLNNAINSRKKTSCLFGIIKSGKQINAKNNITKITDTKEINTLAVIV
jgi:hypothetical protein